MNRLKIATFNVDGINDHQKRHEIFKSLNDLSYDIILLQETHITTKLQDRCNTEWVHPAVWNPGASTNTGGTAILLGNPDIQIVNEKRDNNGRILTVKIKVNNTPIQIVNIYGPTVPAQREAFFSTIQNYMFDDTLTIMGGDFNMVEDPTLDRTPKSTHYYHTQGSKALSQLKQKFDINDNWRTQNPNTKQYTWCSRKQFDNAKSRLDRLYLSPALTSLSHTIIPHILSDHSIVHSNIQLPTNNTPGPGYWKLNTSILQDTEYTTLMTKTLNTIIERRDPNEPLQQWWDALKNTIRTTTIKYCRKKAQDQKRKLTGLHKLLDKTTDSHKQREIKLDIQELHIQKQLGTLIRSREKTILNEEKPTKYFYLQEKQRQSKQHITELHVTNETKIHIYKDKTNIMHTLHSYYHKHYTKQETDPTNQQQFLETITNPLTEEQRNKLEEPITITEIKHTIQSTESNKTPGHDGIPVEFYDTFHTTLFPILTELANDIYNHQNEQPLSQKIGYIKLTHKKGEKTDIKNWRPITLLCTDHKILTKTIATRLRNVLGILIHQDQTCAIPQRHIFQNIYTIRDIITYSNHKREPTYIISYDFQAAFDTVDHQYLTQLLKTYGFGPKFNSFISTIYANRITTVMNNGHFTQYISQNRGLIQGCPLSLPLFTLVAEPLANKIRQHPRITGYNVPGLHKPLKLTQYADDTTTITTKATTIPITMTTFKQFATASGCTLNPKKIKGLTLNTTETPITTPPISWNERTGLKILGITFFQDDQYTQNYNWTQVLNKLKQKLTIHKYRNLSLKGRVTLLHSTLLSKIWFLSTIYPIPPWAHKTLNKHMFSFLWGDAGPDPIRRAVIHLPLDQGGLGLIDPIHQGKALRMKYLFHIFETHTTDTWTYFARYWITRRIAKHSPRWSQFNDNTSPKYNATNLPHHYKLLTQDFVTYKTELLQDETHTTKNIYRIIRTTINASTLTPAETHWIIHLPTPIPWKSLWKHNFTSYNTGKPHDILYRLLHNCLPTRVRLKHNRNHRGTYNTNCKTCKDKDETTLHVFARCSHATDMWKTYRYIYEQLLPQVPFNYEQTALTFNLLLTTVQPCIKKLILTLTTTILYELWQARNKHEKENIRPNAQRSILNISHRLQTIIKAHHKQDTHAQRLENFKQKFTINKTICEITENNTLTFYLP